MAENTHNQMKCKQKTWI